MRYRNRVTRLRLLRCGLLLLPGLLASHVLHAQQSPAVDRFSLWLGAYAPYTDTVVSAAGSVEGRSMSEGVTLEHDLGFQRRKATPRIRLDFLLGEHQGFSIDYYQVHRSRTKALGADVDYAGNHYSASVRVSGKLNFNFGSVAYRWWFGSGNDVFGLGLGAAYYGVHAGISGIATLDGESAQAASSTGARAWAPMLQLGWRHAFDEHARVYANVSGVRKNGGRLDGHIYNAAVGAEWLPGQHVGLGLEYGYTRIRLYQHHSAYDAALDMKLTGPSLFVRARF